MRRKWCWKKQWWSEKKIHPEKLAGKKWSERKKKNVLMTWLGHPNYAEDDMVEKLQQFSTSHFMILIII